MRAFAPLFATVLSLSTLVAPAAGFGSDLDRVYECVADGNSNLAVSGTQEALVVAQAEARSSVLVFKIWPKADGTKAEVEAHVRLISQDGGSIDIFKDPTRPTNIFVNKTIRLDPTTIELEGGVPRSRYRMSALLNLQTGEAAISVSTGIFKKTKLTATYKGCEEIR